MSDVLVQAEQVKTWFTIKSDLGKKHVIRAVDGVSLDIRRGETFGLVGESGSGKSTLGRSILGLNRLREGRVLFDGQDISENRDAAGKAYRRRAQLIFQNPSGCLNPRRTLGRILTDPLDIHKIGDKTQRRKAVLDMMDEVGLGSHCYDRYPYEVSGGQKQRVGIARALLLRPELIVCDEPVSALDVSIQAQVLNLLIELQRTYNLTYLFISHNLGVVNYVCNRIGVMYYGKIVELADRDDLYDRPMHPYTETLISAIPQIDGSGAGRRNLMGDVPDPDHVPEGCRFHMRCPRAFERCRREEPVLTQVGSGHQVACHAPLKTE